MNPEDKFVIPYALLDGKYVTPRRAVHGRDYRCPECLERIVLRRAVVDDSGHTARRTHFAHIGDKETSCSGGTGESEQHKIAKGLVAQFALEWKNGKIRPEFVRVCAGCRKDLATPMPEFASVEVEGQIGELRADVLFVDKDGNKAACEILHTHEMGSRKVDGYRKNLAWWAEITAESVLSEGYRWKAKACSWTECFTCDFRRNAGKPRAENPELQKIRDWLASRPHTKDCRCKKCWTEADKDSGVRRSAPGGDVENARAARAAT